MRKIIAGVFIMVLSFASAHAGEIGFTETYSLAEDRGKVLQQLIPGTEEYYFYHCLQFQHTGATAQFEDMLTQWINRYGHTAKVEEMRNRQALLTWKTDPGKARELVKDRLNLLFNHEKKLQRPQTNYPTSFNNALITWETLGRQAFASRQDLGEFEATALETLAKKESLSVEHRRDLLRRLTRPDLPGLARMVVEDLEVPRHGGFGYIPIHRQMLLAQLNECLSLKPDLLQDSNFVETYLIRLKSSEDADNRWDLREREALLVRLWEFAAKLPPVQNSLRAHILYHRLAHDLAQGAPNKARFMEYIKLPRSVNYMNSDFMDKRGNRDYPANLGANYTAVTGFPSIGSDEKLVRTYLELFFVNEPDYSPYAAFIDSEYLKALFAETKILHGVGDLEQWYSLLSPEVVKALKERIELNFAPANKEVFGAGEKVSLELAVKNVPTLIVKTYRMNAFQYYQTKGEEISTSVDLDGLIANDERVVTYTQPEFKRHAERFEFPQIDKPGVYVVEFIGNGQSSRALIKKGRLTMAGRITSAGHEFTVFDGENRPVKSVAMWMGSRRFDSDEHGEILVPFSTSPGMQKCVLVHDGFAALQQFQHLSESYHLTAGFFVDRESLLEGRTAKLMIRPELKVCGVPVDLSLLQETVLKIETTDHDGVQATKEVRGLVFEHGKEYTYEFKVPEKTARLAFQLRAKVENLSRGKKDDVYADRALDINGIEKTDKIEDFHLRRTDQGYRLSLLGKNGEAKGERAVHLQFKHRDFVRQINANLQTDKNGTIDLGRLENIETVKVMAKESAPKTWTLIGDQRTYQETIHAVAGDPIKIPLVEEDDKAVKDLASLLEVRGSRYYASHADKMKVVDGYLVLENLPGGDYELFLKQPGVLVKLRVTAGRREGVFAVSATRFLQTRLPSLPHLGRVAVDEAKKALLVQVKNPGKNTRVHVVATRFFPGENVFEAMGTPAQPGLMALRLSVPVCQYVSGRNIGDEYRYILERKYAKVFPGNMLKLPSLLLNPWNIRKTDTGKSDAAGGEQWAGEPSPVVGMAAPEPECKVAGGGAIEGGAFTDLDFLAETSVILANLAPGADNQIVVDLEKLGACRQIQVVLVDPNGCAQRSLALPAADEKNKDLRQKQVLDAQQHFSEQKTVSLVPAKTEFVLQDITTARFEAYDALPSVYSLFSTLTGNAVLQEFAFTMEWPTLTPAKKRELYSKYACHELSFFLSKKDPEFFASAVVPYLANKKDKTFMDKWLLQEDLQEFLQPWKFNRLNIVEQILLGKRLKEKNAATSRRLKDLNDLIPPNIEEFNRLFQTALKGSSLETGDKFGLADALKTANLRPAKPMMQARPSAPMPPPPPAPSMSASGRSMAAGVKMKKEMSKSIRREQEASFADEESVASPADMEMDEAFDSPAMESSEKFDGGDLRRDSKRRERVQQFYRALDKTEEWVENNYYRLPIQQQTASLITVNSFWVDYAAHDGTTPFTSKNLAQATRNFPEMMLALAVLDLPFAPEKHETVFAETRMTLKPGNPAVIFHKEIKEVQLSGKNLEILTSQNFFAQNDRYRFEGNQQFDKWVTEEFQVGRVYGCQVVLTNPNSTRKKIDALLQIPQGSLPVLNGFYTKSIHVSLEPFSTQTVEYAFYFPAPGTFTHYPVHVAENEKIIGFTSPFVFTVVDELTKFDKTSWEYISQNGTDKEVLAFLNENNIERFDLGLIAFRLRDKAFYDQLLPLLGDRLKYHDVLWSYSVLHQDVPRVREFLAHSTVANNVGWYIDSPVLTVDPVARHRYEHKEYWPLVNARVYQLGKKRQILNQQLFEQYLRLMEYLQYKPGMNDEDFMAVVYYLLLQDRTTEAVAFFARLKDPKVLQTIQYEYLKAFLAFCLEKPEEAVAIAQKYREYPVDRWRNLFLDILGQADEIQGKTAGLVDKEDRTQVQTKLAASEPSFDFKVEDRKITLQYQNINSCTINYYLMDIELLFSKNPFVQEVSGKFSVIHPNETAAVQVPTGSGSMVIPLPEKFRDANVMVEILAEGKTVAKALYSHSMAIQIMENYGQVKVAEESSAKPLSKTYIKVFARMKGGEVKFYKDGYTDLRGRFDFTSLSTSDLENVERFSILVMSEKHGAVIREAAPPKM